jgi:hypothetical protein
LYCAQAVTEILRNIKVAAESKRTRDRCISKHLQSREGYDSKLAAEVFEFQSDEATDRDPTKTVPGQLLNWPAADESPDRNGVAVPRITHKSLRGAPGAARCGFSTLDGVGEGGVRCSRSRFGAVLNDEQKVAGKRT